MKRNYSYFIIKPDGIRFLNNICSIIENSYEGVRYYAIDDFSDVIKRLYYKHFEKKGDKFAKSFEAYLYGLREFFGNYGILALVADSKREYTDFAQSVYSTKLRIRSEYANNNIGIVTNYGDGQKNKIKIVDVEGKESNPRIMDELGNHRISDVNIIHCPDPSKEDTLKELSILFRRRCNRR